MLPGARNPDLELLRRLAPPHSDTAAAARLRRRCHEVMTRGSRQRSGVRRSLWPEAVLVLSVGAYLVAAVSAVLRLAGAL